MHRYIKKERPINSMSKKFNYVYKTTNRITGKSYVGSHCTDNIDDNYIGSGRLFLKSVKKHGKLNFEREILEICIDASAARMKENFYIGEFGTLCPSGYNLCPDGGIGFKGATHSEATKKKIGAWQKGKTYEELYGPEKAAEMKEKQRLAKLGKSTPRKGKGHKQELIEKYGVKEGTDRYNTFIEKQSESHKGKPTWIKGKNHTEETKDKIRTSTSGKNHHNWGKKLDDELKEKMKKPHNTRQKEMMEDASLTFDIKKLRDQNFSYADITKKTGINYFLLKTII